MTLFFGDHSSKGSVSKSTKEASDGFVTKGAKTDCSVIWPHRAARYETAQRSHLSRAVAITRPRGAFQIIETAADRYSVQRGDDSRRPESPVPLDLIRPCLGYVE